MKAYIASPFFNEEQLKKVSTLENILDECRIDYFSPRLGIASKVYGALPETHPDLDLFKNVIFSQNLCEMKDADVLYVSPEDLDSGTLFEIGYWIGTNRLNPKPIISFDNSYTSNNLINIYKACIEDLGNYINYFNDYPKSVHVHEDKLSLVDLSDINDYDDVAYMVFAEGKYSGKYLGISKVVLGYLYARGFVINYFDVPRKSNLMLTCAVNMWEVKDLEKYEDIQSIYQIEEDEIHLVKRGEKDE